MRELRQKGYDASIDRQLQLRIGELQELRRADQGHIGHQLRTEELHHVSLNHTGEIGATLHYYATLVAATSERATESRFDYDFATLCYAKERWHTDPYFYCGTCYDHVATSTLLRYATLTSERK